MRIYLQTLGRKNPLGARRMLVRKGSTFCYRHFATGIVQKVSGTGFDFGIPLLIKPIN